MSLKSEPFDFVDPFLGNGATDLPTPEGIAATWFWPKAQVGNTHPGACFPFGMISACAYSGAYPTGYGWYDRSTEGQPGKLFHKTTASGFTHFQQSGTGDMRFFYNYVRVMPYVGPLDECCRRMSGGERFEITEETAQPGYYSAQFAGTGIRGELTVGPKIACHRYSLEPSGSASLWVDLSNNGVAVDGRHHVPEEAHVDLTDEDAARASVVINGLPFYVSFKVEGHPGKFGLWAGDEILEAREFALERSDSDENKPFGFYYVFDGEEELEIQAEVKVAFSFRSMSRAEDYLEEIGDEGFEGIRSSTGEAWRDHLGRIVVDAGSDAEATLFYSALYHSLIKPSRMDDESPFWPEDGPFFSDISTLWDIYKTQVPLMLSVYPETGGVFINALLEMAERHHRFPIGYVMASPPLIFEKQASALGHLCVADAFFRGLKGIDYKRALDLMLYEINNDKGATFQSQRSVFPFTHTLDLASACFVTAQMARAIGKGDLYKSLMRLAGWWRNVFNKETGSLSASEYYEGGAENYSYRLMHDMDSRIALCGSRKEFVEQLDRFFGYGAEPCEQLGFPTDTEVEKAGYALGRFTGMNNEPDMETPYAYIYAGRPDRTAEVVRAVTKFMYSTGRGGLPGNDDSGALSSWYVWSTLGIFPVSGQEIYLIGTPHFERSEVKMGPRVFVIGALNHAEGNIYVQSARLNGQEIDRAYLRIDEFEDGGELELEMGPEPSKWGTKLRPPSYRI